MGSHIRLIDWSLPPWLLNQSAGEEGRQAGQQSERPELPAEPPRCR